MSMDDCFCVIFSFIREGDSSLQDNVQVTGLIWGIIK